MARVVEFAAQAATVAGVPVDEIDLGGGLPIAYVATDQAPDLADFAADLAGVFEAEVAAHGGRHVGEGRALLATARRAWGASCWPGSVTREKSPSRQGVVRATARSDHWRSAGT